MRKLLLVLMLLFPAFSFGQTAALKFTPVFATAYNPNFRGPSTCGNYSDAELQQIANFDMLNVQFDEDDCFKKNGLMVGSPPHQANSYETLQYFHALAGWTTPLLVNVYNNGPHLYTDAANLSIDGLGVNALKIAHPTFFAKGYRLFDYLTGSHIGGVYDCCHWMDLTLQAWRDYWETFVTVAGLTARHSPHSFVGVTGTFIDNTNFPLTDVFQEGHTDNDAPDGSRLPCDPNHTIFFCDSPDIYETTPFVQSSAKFRTATLNWIDRLSGQLEALSPAMHAVPNWFSLLNDGVGWSQTDQRTNPPYAGMTEGIFSTIGGRTSVGNQFIDAGNIATIVANGQDLAHTKFLYDNSVYGGCPDLTRVESLVEVADNDVTWDSGDTFSASIFVPGHWVAINGVPHQVAVWLSTTHFTIQGSPVNPPISQVFLSGNPLLNLTSSNQVIAIGRVHCDEHFWATWISFHLVFDTVLRNGYLGYGDYNNPVFQDEWNSNYVHLGQQIGKALQTGEIWSRHFDDGYMIYNGDSSTHTFSVPGGASVTVCNHQNFKNADKQCGHTLVTSYALGGGKAVILLADGKFIDNSDNPEGPALLTITTASLPSGVENAAYSQTTAATGGTPPYTWSTTGGSLPPGITQTAAVLAGTPTLAGTYSFTITVTDAVMGTANKNLSIQIVPAPGGGNRVLIASDAFTNASSACLGTYDAAHWADINDGGSTNCAKVDAAADVVYGSTDDYYGWVSRRKETFTSDQYCSLKIKAIPADGTEGAKFVGCGVRIAAATSTSRSLYQAVIYKSGTTTFTSLGKVVNGFYSGLDFTTSAVWTVDSRIEIEAVGTTITLMRDGVPILTKQDASLTGGSPGVVMAGGSGSASSGDDFQGGNIFKAVTGTPAFLRLRIHR